MSDDEFFQRLRATFRVEAEEHLQTIADGLLRLEQVPAGRFERGMVDSVFRAAHSLKGAARAVDFVEIESACASLEDLFADWKRLDTAPPPEAFDAAHRLVDGVSRAMERYASAPAAPVRGAPSAPPASLPISPAPPSEQGAGVSVAAAPETVRIPIAALDARLLAAEEMLTAKVAARHRAEALRELSVRLASWTRERTGIEPLVRTLRQSQDTDRMRGRQSDVPRLLEFLNRTLDHLEAAERSAATITRAAEQDHLTLGKLVDDLLADSKQLLLLPFGRVTAGLPKMVRDLSRDQGKRAELAVRGENVHLDKRILEELKAPLIHLLRNAVDHGVEPPEARARAGKSEQGTITLSAAAVEDGKVAVEILDDGPGIDVDRVRAAAVEHGVLTADQAATFPDDRLPTLIFETGLSTRDAITRVSGRGLGLAIVREHVDRLGGRVSVESRPGQGTRFSLVVPTTLATFRGILVDTAGRTFVVPALQVERVVRVKADDVRTVEAREVISLDGRAVSLVRLAQILQLPAEAGDAAPAHLTALVLGSGEQRIACAIDALLGEQEVLVKPLRPPLKRVRYVAGATVLGSGRVAPILNVGDLLQAAGRVRPAETRRPAADMRTAPAMQKSVLVAEDSITSRMLIRGILESAGYRVSTAVDGMEAFAMLRAERFDLLLSDVEMPRLNGFDLTARIRADRKLAELPVVLITALDTPEHHARGVGAGADAYIVKSRLDQDSLLDVLRRLV